MKPWQDCPPCPECKCPAGTPVGYLDHDALIVAFDEGHNLYCPACGHSWRSNWREDRQAIVALMAWAAETWPRGITKVKVEP